MRSAIVAGLWVLCAALAGAQEGVVPLDDGFTSVGSNFRVVFAFSGMRGFDPYAISRYPGHNEPRVWSGKNGAKARLEICCVKRAVGLNEGTLAVARVRLTNPSEHPFSTALSVCITPDLEIHALAFDRHAFFIEGHPVLVAMTPSHGAILADSPFAARGLVPQELAHVESAKGECRGEMLYDIVLQPGQTQTLDFIVPVHLPVGAEPDLDFYRALSADELFEQVKKDAAAK